MSRPSPSATSACALTRSTSSANRRLRSSRRGMLDATIAVTLEESGDVLKQGAILVDEADEDGLAPRVLVTLEHAIRDGRPGRNGQLPAVAAHFARRALVSGWRSTPARAGQGRTEMPGSH